MSQAIAGALLAIGVLCVWLGCVGFVRLSSAYDRVHCVTFVSVTAGFAVMLACWVSQGASESILKVVSLVLFALLNGAALGHATGRAVLHRERSAREEDP